MSLVKIAFDFGLWKEARSYQSQRERGYTQLMKSQYGDLDTYQQELLNARGDAEPPAKGRGFRQFEQNLKALQSGETPVYSKPTRYLPLVHGTSADNAANILREGFNTNAGQRSLLGKGGYFTTAESAKGYMRPFGQLLFEGSDGNPILQKLNPRSLANLSMTGDSVRNPFARFLGNPYETPDTLGQEFQKRQNAVTLAERSIAKNPNRPFPGLTYKPGASVRLALPNELSGKQLYPKKNRDYRVVDIQQARPDLQLSKEETLRTNATGKLPGEAKRMNFSATGAPYQLHFKPGTKLPPSMLRPQGNVPGYNAPINQSPPMTTNQLNDANRMFQPKSVTKSPTPPKPKPLSTFGNTMSKIPGVGKLFKWMK